MPIDQSLSGGVLSVTLNRPEVHNAFDEALIASLTAAFETAATDGNVRVILLRGEGKSFCAGADLNWMRRMAAFSETENLEDARRTERMFAAIASCPSPVIALVHGAALGGGAGLAAACDVAIASTAATFALSEVRLGLVPAIIGPYVLRKVGMGPARALFVTGERIDATEALRIGLVQKVVAPDALEATGQALVELILAAGPSAIAAAKQLLDQIAGMPLAEAAEITTRCIAHIRASDEGREGVQAFLEKRTPAFSRKPG